MIPVALGLALLAFVAGACLEAHLCTHRRQVVAWKQYGQNAVRSASKYRGAARHWYAEYGKATRTAEGHAQVLAALGRAVGEGQSVDGSDG